MKIFLSLGMSGRDEKDILADIAEATHYAKDMVRFAHTECEVVNGYQQEAVLKDVGPTYCLGRSIQILGSCDQAWFLNNWKNYRGCLVEHEVCKTYGIPRYALDLRTGRVGHCEDSEDSKNPSAYQTFQFFKQTISNARDAISDTRKLVSEYKDMYPNANLLLDASESALSIGVDTINHLIHIIEIDE